MSKTQVASGLVEHWERLRATPSQHEFWEAYNRNTYNLYTDDSLTESTVFRRFWYALCVAIDRSVARSTTRVREKVQNGWVVTDTSRMVPTYRGDTGVCEDNYLQLEPGGPCWSVGELVKQWKCAHGKKKCAGNSIKGMSARERRAFEGLLEDFYTQEKDVPVGPADTMSPSDTALFTRMRLRITDHMTRRLSVLWRDSGARHHPERTCASESERFNRAVDTLFTELERARRGEDSVLHQLSALLQSGVLKAAGAVKTVMSTFLSALSTLATLVVQSFLKVVLGTLSAPEWLLGKSGDVLRWILGAETVDYIAKVGVKSYGLVEKLFSLLNPVRCIVVFILTNPLMTRAMILFVQTVRNATFEYMGHAAAGNAFFMDKFQRAVGVDTALLERRDALGVAANTTLMDRKLHPGWYKAQDRIDEKVDTELDRLEQENTTDGSSNKLVWTLMTDPAILSYTTGNLILKANTIFEKVVGNTFHVSTDTVVQTSVVAMAAVGTGGLSLAASGITAAVSTHISGFITSELRSFILDELNKVVGMYVDYTNFTDLRDFLVPSIQMDNSVAWFITGIKRQRDYRRRERAVANRFPETFNPVAGLLNVTPTDP